MSVVIALLLADVATALEADPALAERFRALLAPTAPTDLYVTGPESKIAARTLKRLVKEGRITAFRVGREHRYLRSECDAYIASRAQVKVAPVVGDGDEVDAAIARKRGPK